MTPPMTPREKVGPSLDELLRQAVETMKSWTPEQREAHFEAQKKAWVAAEMAFGDEGTRVITALASGSGDHEELEYYGYRAFNAGIGFCHLVANPGPNDTNPEPLVTAASAEALLAENAALRAERDGMVEEVSRSQARLHAATEAGRKLAEAVGLLEDLSSWFTVHPGSGRAWSVPSGDLGADDAVNAVRAFLSKEAERG